MKKVLLGVILGVLGMYAWDRTRPPRPVVVTSPAHPDDNAVERTRRSAARDAALPVRWAKVLLADDLVRGGDVLPAQLPGRKNGR